jgi:hypothetical protein
MGMVVVLLEALTDGANRSRRCDMRRPSREWIDLVASCERIDNADPRRVLGDARLNALDI